MRYWRRFNRARTTSGRSALMKLRGGIAMCLVVIVVVVVLAIALNWKSIQRERRMRREGDEAVGWAVNVDPMLFKKPQGQEDFAGPVGLIFAEDPKDGFDPDFMLGLIDRCHEV